MLIIAENEALLVAAMESGVIPPELQSRPLEVEKTDERIVIRADKLGKDVTNRLKAAGFEVKRSGKMKDPVTVSCWAEILSVRPAPEPEPPLGEILFASPPGRGYLMLSAELLRLGSDRQELCFFGEDAGNPRCLCRIADPPYYVILRAMEQDEGLRAFSCRDGRKRVWVEVGYTHDMAGRIAPADGELLLIPGNGSWESVPDGEWLDFHECAEIELVERLEVEPRDAPEPLQVNLTLTRMSNPPPAALWVLRENGEAQLDRLVRSVPDSVVGRLSFVRLERSEEEPVFVLKARGIGEVPPELDLEAETYTPHNEILNLFVPVGQSISPPLRAVRLRELLAPDIEYLVWTVKEEDGTFALEQVEDDAFSPLTEWVEYVARSNADQLAPWIKSTAFDFESFVSIGCEWADGPKKEVAERRPTARRKRAATEPVVVEEVAEAVRAVSEAAAPALSPLTLPELKVESREAEQELAKVERKLCELGSAADDPDRVDLWIDIAMKNAAIKRDSAANLCFANALWEIDPVKAFQVSDAWCRSSARTLDVYPRDLPEIAQKETPSDTEIRALASFVIDKRVKASSVDDLQQMQQFFLKNDPRLDLRTLWLVRSALAALAGGDRLALLQTRDRIVDQLRGGLSLSKDVPSFVRTFGTDEGTNDVVFLAEQLEVLFGIFEKTNRKRSTNEAPTKLTNAYVRLAFAWGYARLGRPEQAQEERDAALSKLDTNDATHGFLTAAFSARIAQALEGAPVEAPLPPELVTQLEALSRFDRYKVDRVRQASDVLEWTHELDPFSGFSQKSETIQDEFQLAGLKGDTLAEEVGKLLSRAKDEPKERSHLLEVVTEFMALLPEAHAVPHIKTMLVLIDDVQPKKRASLLEEALIISGSLERADLVSGTLEKLRPTLKVLAKEDPVVPARLLSRCARVLRRANEADAGVEILKNLSSLISGKDADTTVVRLQVAAAMATLGDTTEVDNAIQSAHGLLKLSKLLPQDRLRVIRQMTLALSRTSLGKAAGGVNELMKQLTQITDSFNTNSHLCLSVLHFMESMVLGFAGGVLTVSEKARDMIDESEHRLRRRIYQELSA